MASSTRMMRLMRLALAGIGCALLTVPACRLGESLDDYASGSAGSAGSGGTTDASTAGAAGMPEAAAGSGGGGGVSDAGVDADAEAGCSPGTKPCPTGCESEADPAVGCAAVACDPCVLANATATCDQGSCAVDTCDDGWDDCDGDLANGCEHDVSADLANCGACDKACNAGESCLGGLCCSDGLENCDGVCVDTTTAVEHCNGCGSACTDAPTGGSPACEASSCTFTCASPLQKCGTECVDTDTDLAHCGGCGSPCPTSTGGDATCTAGVCGLDCYPTHEPCGGDCADLETDPDHCGSCGRSCFGGACLGGSKCGPVVLSLGNTGPTQLAVDGSAVYWLNANGEVKKRELTASSDVVLASNQNDAASIDVDAQHVYWALPVVARVNRVPVAGGTTSLFMSSIPGAGGVVLDAQDAFISYGTKPGYLWRKPKTTGAGAVLEGTTERPVGLAIESGTLYWAVRLDDKVFRFPLPSGPVEVLADALSPADVAVYQGTVFYTNTGDGSVRRTTGGGTHSVIASSQPGPTGIAADATGVYWVDTTAGKVLRAPLGGGTTEELATGQSSPWDVALDVTSVYWTNSGSGQVMRLAK